MSAPLVVSTRDGACWTRRAVTEGGIALYAPEAVKTCPEFVMATLAELAERGIVGSADALPMPVGPEADDRAKAPWGRGEDGRPLLPMGAHWTDVPEAVDRRVAKVQARVDEAQPGPWYRAPATELGVAPGTVRTRVDGYPRMVGQFTNVSPADLELVLYAGSDLRWCLEMIAKFRARGAELEAARKQTTAHVDHMAKTLVARTEDLIAAEARVAELEAAQGKALRRTVSWRLEVQENDCWWDCGQSADSYPAAQDLLARERAEKPGIGFRLVCRTTTDALPGEASSYPPALPWAKHMDADDLEGFLADLADAASGDDDLTTLAAVEDAIGRWRVIGEAQHAHNTAPGPDAEAGEPS